MKLNQKDLILISYPFSNLKQNKVRPVIIISNDQFNTSSEDLIALPITSVLREYDHSIKLTTSDLAEGKLIRESIIRTDKVFNIEKKLIIKRIGKVKESTFSKIRKDIINLI